MMYQLIYVSRVARQVRFADVEAIAAAAAERNARNDISGLLLYMPSHFVQVLEGPSASVEHTFQRILRDERHQDVRVVVQGPVPARRFGAWAMTARLLPPGITAKEIDAATGAELDKILLQAS